MVHRASDLSFVGFLQKSDGTGIASVCYAGPNQVISFPTTSTSVPFVTFYTVDWSTLTVGAAGRSVATPTTTEFTPQTPQGIAYDVSTGAFYTCGNGTSAERYILRYDISGATAAITGRWWNIPASVSAASAAGEPQGIFCDVSGALSMIGLDGTDNTKCSLFSLGLSYGASEISNAVYQNQGAGAFCWAPNIIASTAAALISQVPITGPVRSIFGMSRVSQAGTAASSNTPTFMSWGLQDATAARRLQFQESSTQNSFVKTNLLRNKNGGTSQDAVVTCTDIRTPSTYETRWDGTTVSYYQNPKADSPATGLLGNYTDNVPPLSDIGGMVEEMVCGTTSTNVTMGSGVLAYYIARGKQLPAGQPDPTFTVN